MKVLIGLTVGCLLRLAGFWLAEAGYRIELWAGTAMDYTAGGTD